MCLKTNLYIYENSYLKTCSQSESAISRPDEDWTAILSHRDVGDEFD